MTRRKVDPTVKNTHKVTIHLSQTYFEKMERWLSHSDYRSVSELARSILYKEKINWYMPMERTKGGTIYMGVSVGGYLLILTGGTWLSRLIKLKFKKDIFNNLNESFPQEERLLENEYSINLPSAYNLKGKRRKSWINVINPFRSTLVIGTPGAGKSYFVVRHIITQHIRKAFTMFIYDFKYDNLTRITYNALLKNSKQYPIMPKFYVINFEDLSRTHRCNPLDPATMDDITDATESSRTIMLGLNREWIER